MNKPSFSKEKEAKRRKHGLSTTTRATTSARISKARSLSATTTTQKRRRKQQKNNAFLNPEERPDTQKLEQPKQNPHRTNALTNGSLDRKDRNQLKTILTKSPCTPTAQEAMFNWYTAPDQERYAQLWREVELPKLLHMTPERYAKYLKEGMPE
jgi:hypothetical protein